MKEEKPIYQIVTQDGEILEDHDVVYAYTREGRRVIGKEYPNPVPMEPPLGFVPQEPLHEQIRNMVLREMSAAASREELETAEEADDFDIGDDFDPDSPYEMDFDPLGKWPPQSPLAPGDEPKSGGEGGPSPPSDAPGAAPPPPAEPSS